MSIVLIAAFALAACGTATQAPVAATEAPAQPAATAAPAATSAPAQAGGEVYYLNFKPEVADTYAKIADEYKAETGVTLKVVTAAAGTYE